MEIYVAGIKHNPIIGFVYRPGPGPGDGFNWIDWRPATAQKAGQKGLAVTHTLTQKGLALTHLRRPQIELPNGRESAFALECQRR